MTPGHEKNALLSYESQRERFCRLSQQLPDDGEKGSDESDRFRSKVEIFKLLDAEIDQASLIDARGPI